MLLFIVVVVYCCCLSYFQTTLIECLFQVGMEWMVTVSSKHNNVLSSTDNSSSPTPDAVLMYGRLAGLYLIWTVFYTHTVSPSVRVRDLLMSTLVSERETFIVIL